MTDRIGGGVTPPQYLPVLTLVRFAQSLSGLTAAMFFSSSPRAVADLRVLRVLQFCPALLHVGA